MVFWLEGLNGVYNEAVHITWSKDRYLTGGEVVLFVEIGQLSPRALFLVQATKEHNSRMQNMSKQITNRAILFQAS